MVKRIYVFEIEYQFLKLVAVKRCLWKCSVSVRCETKIRI